MRPVRELRSALSGLLWLMVALAGWEILAAETPTVPEHWAFQTVAPVQVPTNVAPREVRNPIDAFVFDRFGEHQLGFSPAADRRTLIRRASIDLLGLPPTPAEVAEFVHDQRPAAYERLIDRLLDSPRYGERWARFWLDLVRYAESNGFKKDEVRPSAWRYRDYVIRSLNADKGYDRFVREQLAGDELSAADADALVATGFLTHWPWEDIARNLTAVRERVLNDVTDVTGQVFLGLTLGCARCHDHKFDPISQRDYYGLLAFFAGIAPRDDWPVGSPAQRRTYADRLARWQDATRDISRQRERVARRYYENIQREKAQSFPDHVRAIALKPVDDRSSWERQVMMLAGSELLVSEEEMVARLSQPDRERWDELTDQLTSFDELRPQLPLARGVRDISPSPPATTIPGDATDEPVKPGLPLVFEATSFVVADPAPASASSGRRRALAEWITRSSHPLTARVLVNRLWQHHFGEGLVATESDFGLQGQAPTHPRLLDWLAREFVEHDWSWKHIHRLIMTSATYRQSSKPCGPHEEQAARVDPDNRLLWRQNPRRVEAEVIRDSILATSGSLVDGMYGESVWPDLPRHIVSQYRWQPTASAQARHRRSIYLGVKRNMQVPLLVAFDQPDNHSSCPQRAETITSSQALLLLNDAWAHKQAREFADRLLREVNCDSELLVRRAHQVAFGRPPDPEEQTISVA